MNDENEVTPLSGVIGYVPGVYDLFHVGHLNMLRQARERCDILVAGVVSDEMSELGKNVTPTVPLAERVEIVGAIGIVDRVYVENSLDKRAAWNDVKFNRLFKGDDWQGTAKGAKLEAEMAEVGVEVCYFPYTQQTSSTALRRALGEPGVQAS